MITRSNLAEQLREYQIRSKHDWDSLSFFSSTSNLTPSSLLGEVQSRPIVRINRTMVDIGIFVIWELVILAFFFSSSVSLYFRRSRVAITLLCITMLLFLFMKITKQVRLAGKKKPRMILPLSM